MWLAMYNGYYVSRSFSFSIVAPGSSSSLFRFTKSWNVQFSTIESYSSSRPYGNTPLYAYQPSNSVLGPTDRLRTASASARWTNRVETVYIIYSTQSYFISVIKKRLHQCIQKSVYFLLACLLLLLGSLFIVTVDHRTIFELKFIMKFFKYTLTSCALDFTK